MSLVLITAQTVSADSVRSTVRQANKLYDTGHFNEAIKEYDQALTDQPQLLEPKFNKADCYFQLDDLTEAINLYKEVAADSKDMKLVARAKYNLGNCYFKQGSRQKDSDPQKALEDLQTSIVCWRGAMEIDPENKNAAKNIEIARLTIKDIIDQMNKQKEQRQQQAEKQKQLQQQLKELAEKQKSLTNQTQQTKEQEEKGQTSPQDAADNYKKQAEEQSQLKKEADKASQQMQPQDQNTPQMQQAAGEMKQAMDKQSDAETKLKASDGAAAKQSQDKAAEHLDNALKALSDANQQNQQQQKKSQQPQEPNQPGKEEQQQQNQQEQKASAAPDTTAQEILDKEQQEKKQRQILERADYQKVDKDW